MDAWSLVTAAIALLVAGAVLTVWWGRARRIADVAARMALALTELDEFFALLDISNDDAHFLDRHGPMLKRCDVLQRAQNGRLDVSGHIGSPVASARWLRHADLLRAVMSACEHWKSGSRPKRGCFLFDFGEDIGEGFRKGGGDLVRTRFAAVIVRKGTVVTAYPLLARPDGRDPIEMLSQV